jgi:outer membrane protein OmpA-like peptidoglycan-associated protein
MKTVIGFLLPIPIIPSATQLAEAAAVCFAKHFTGYRCLIAAALGITFTLASPAQQTVPSEPTPDLHKLQELMQQKGGAWHAPSGSGSGSGSGPAIVRPVALPKWTSISAAEAASAPRIALQPAMTMVSAVSDSLLGDYEAILTIVSVDNGGVRMTASAEVPMSFLGLLQPKNPQTRKTAGKKFDRTDDLRHAAGSMTYFSAAFPEEIRGTLAFLLSTDVMSQLKSTGRADLTQVQDDTKGRMAMFDAALGPSEQFWAKLPKTTCILIRAEAEDVAFPILIDGRSTHVPAIHATCSGDRSTHHYILDNPQLPILLGGVSATGQGQVTQINYPATPAPKTASLQPAGASGLLNIEKSLKQSGHADVYGIYFDFDKDEIRRESEPVLQEIARALGANPSWILSVDGHTDSIGSTPHNLDLSNRRAAAVAKALVTRYHIESARLRSRGFGASRPLESNDTIEGRARNRRVALERL